jgi:hypothetical protein
LRCGISRAPGYQYLQIGFIAIEWPLAILSNAAIDDSQVRLDTTIHIHDALVDTEGMHRAAVRPGQNTHWIFHAERHGRDNMRLENGQVNQTRLAQYTRDAESA